MPNEYHIQKMYNVRPQHRPLEHSIAKAANLQKAREEAEGWCKGKNKEPHDRAAVITLFSPERRQHLLLETYVEDTGGSGKVVCTRKYNPKTGKSTLV